MKNERVFLINQEELRQNPKLFFLCIDFVTKKWYTTVIPLVGSVFCEAMDQCYPFYMFNRYFDRL